MRNTDPLAVALGRCGWQHKQEMYVRNIRRVFLPSRRTRPLASIIVISNRSHPNTHACLRVLRQNRQCEIVFVNNGMGSDISANHQCVDKHITTAADYGANRPRNIGAAFATGYYLVFVDDDGIPHRRMIRELLAAHRTYDIVSCMGCCKPLTGSPWNYDAHHYYMGPRPFPYWTNLEGCCCIRSDIFYAAGGWDDNLRFGGGGYDLSLHMLAHEPDKRRYAYIPTAILGHDYSTGSAHLLAKRRTQISAAAERFAADPSYYRHRDAWVWMAGRENLLMRRT
jgi:GT2 family glycosyltransferase